MDLEHTFEKMVVYMMEIFLKANNKVKQEWSHPVEHFI